MPYGGRGGGNGGGKKDFVQSYCQSTARYLNMSDLHELQAAMMRLCFMAQSSSECEGNKKYMCISKTGAVRNVKRNIYKTQ